VGREPTRRGPRKLRWRAANVSQSHQMKVWFTLPLRIHRPLLRASFRGEPGAHFALHAGGGA
jgi:hypothetical protein